MAGGLIKPPELTRGKNHGELCRMHRQQPIPADLCSCEIRCNFKIVQTFFLAIKRFPALTFESFLNQYRTDLVIGIHHLTVQTIETFIDIDVAFGMDRLDHAFVGTALTGATTFLVPLEPGKHAHSSRNGQRRTQRAQVAAVKSFDKNARQQYR